MQIMKCEHTPSSPCHHMFQRQTGAQSDEYTCRCICWEWILKQCWVAVLCVWICRVEEAFTFTQQPANKTPPFYLMLLGESSRHRVNRHFSTMWKHSEHTWSISVHVKGWAPAGWRCYMHVWTGLVRWRAWLHLSEGRGTGSREASLLARSSPLAYISLTRGLLGARTQP